MFRQLIPAVAIAIVAPAALATDRWYRDCSATSPSGRYRIDAKSPENAGPNPRPFAANFTYTLTDTTTGKTVWTRQQPMRRSKGESHAYSEEPSPVFLFVTDGGLVVARSAWDSLIVLDQASGKKRGEFRLLDAFPKAEQDDFVHNTTAGPMWSQRSDWFFVNVPAADKTPATTLFVVRPFWRHRIVIDCATASQLDLGVYHSAAAPEDLNEAKPEIKRALTAIMNDEAACARADLKHAKVRLTDPRDYGALWAVETALDTAAFRKLADTEPDIRRLEAWLPTQPESAHAMQAVRQSLRAMGKVPMPGCGVQLYAYIRKEYYITPDTAKPFTAAVPTETARAERAQDRRRYDTQGSLRRHRLPRCRVLRRRHRVRLRHRRNAALHAPHRHREHGDREAGPHHHPSRVPPRPQAHVRPLTHDHAAHHPPRPSPHAPWHCDRVTRPCRDGRVRRQHLVVGGLCLPELARRLWRRHALHREVRYPSPSLHNQVCRLGVRPQHRPQLQPCLDVDMVEMG
ncbi:MAG: hypothetical protein QM783_09640 [Phycisphaerales bacterium]